MTSRDFCYWLQGYFEIASAGINAPALTPQQVSMVQRHLSLVFKHEIDPSLDGGDEGKRIERLLIHNGPTAKLSGDLTSFGANWPQRDHPIVCALSC